MRSGCQVSLSLFTALALPAPASPSGWEGALAALDDGRWLEGAGEALATGSGAPEGVLEELLADLEAHAGDPAWPDAGGVLRFQALQRRFFTELPRRGVPRFPPELVRRMFVLGEVCLAQGAPIEGFTEGLRLLLEARALGPADLLLAGLRREAPRELHPWLARGLDLPGYFGGPDRRGFLPPGRPRVAFPSASLAAKVFRSLDLHRNGGLGRALAGSGVADAAQAGEMQRLLEAFQGGPDGDYLPASPLVFFAADPEILAWGFRNAGILGTEGMGPWMRLLLQTSLPPERHGPLLEIALSRLKAQGLTGSARLYLRERVEIHYRLLDAGLEAHRDRLLALLTTGTGHPGPADAGADHGEP